MQAFHSTKNFQGILHRETPTQDGSGSPRATHQFMGSRLTGQAQDYLSGED